MMPETAKSFARSASLYAGRWRAFMSKRHFIALADELRRVKPEKHWDPNKMVQWELDVKAIADVCRSFNSAFDRSRWMGYINGENGPSGGAIKKAS